MRYEKRPRVFDELVLKSWWTILFFFLSLFGYEQAGHRRKMEEDQLKYKMHQIEQAIEQEKLLQEELQRELHSLNDPSSLELILMDKLGLVPEGQIKVIFP